MENKFESIAANFITTVPIFLPIPLDLVKVETKIDAREINLY